MQLLVIDVETTGLDPERHQVLELAAIYFDTAALRPPMDLARDIAEHNATIHGPEFHTLVNPGEIVGEPEALAMNAELLEAIASSGNQEVAKPTHYAYAQLWGFAQEHHRTDAGPLHAAGANVGSFDLPFIRRMAHSVGVLAWPFHHRTIEVGGLWARAEDDAVPGLLECANRAGLDLDYLRDGDNIAHRAMDDARLTLQVIARGLVAREAS